MDRNNKIGQDDGAEDPRVAIWRLFAAGEVDANTATRRLLLLDSQRRRRHAGTGAEDSGGQP